MKQIGFKIDNCDCEENIEKLNRYFEFNKQFNGEIPLEVGVECYGIGENFLKQGRQSDFNSKIFQLIRKNHPKHLVIHLNLVQKLLNIESIPTEKWIEGWKEQLNGLSGINVKYFVFHGTSAEMKKFTKEEIYENMKKNLNILLSLSDIPFYMENTYEDLDFYEEFFNYIDTKKLGFVLDIGHIKIHSNDDNSENIKKLENIKKNCCGIHFHIHDNDGIKDQHLPITYTNNKKTNDFVISLIKGNPQSIFILENRMNNFDDSKKDFYFLNH